MSERPTTIKYPKLAGPRLFPKFEPRDTIQATSKAFFASTLFGFGVAVIRGNLGPHQSVFGGLRANIRNVWVFSAVGTSYAFVEAVSANMRRTESPLNAFLGGAAAGGIIGSVLGSTPKVFGGAFVVGSILAVAEWSGGIKGLGREQALEGGLGEASDIEPAEGQAPRQGFWELVQRRPLSQTVEQLGSLAKPLLDQDPSKK